MSHRARMRPLVLCALALAGTLAPGCARHEPSAPAVTARWVAARSRPAFDPDGPPDALRWALERLLTRSLVREDSSGRIAPDAAERFSVSRDRLTWTFTLRGDLRYPGGTVCTSHDFRDALVAGLRRTDHSSRLWLLSAVRGVEAVRAGRPLPALGIETPDPHTLVLHLVRPDALLPRKLALPGVSAVWRTRGPGTDWMEARGLGPYRVASALPGRLRLIRGGPAGAEAPDTVEVRFIPSTSRVRSLLRADRVDLLWPRPPGLDAVPAGYLERTSPAHPSRWMWLVMRADVPPTSKLAARHALAHAINRGDVNLALGTDARPGEVWLAGAPPFDFPKLDAAAVTDWLDRAGLGRSCHVTLAYDAEGPASAAARGMQGVASRLNIYVELKPLRGGAMGQEALTGNTQLLLVEGQALMDRPGAVLAQLVMPLRGPAVGGFRTGWRTREFDPWIVSSPPATALDAGHAGERLAEELVALPLAELPWEWVTRSGGPPVRIHPHFGPEFSAGHSAGAGALSH